MSRRGIFILIFCNIYNILWTNYKGNYYQLILCKIMEEREREEEN